jgi:transcriptional regulator with GAF, ATPase, and Fis domain
MSAYQLAASVLSNTRKVFPPMLSTDRAFEDPLDNRLNPAELQRERSCIRMLLELTSRVAPAQDLRDVVRTAIANIRRMLHSDGAIFLLRDTLRGEDSGELQVYALDVPSGAATLREGATIPFEGSVAGRVFSAGQPWTGIVQDARTLSPALALMLSKAGFRIGCKLPILIRNRVAGALVLGRGEGGLYDQQELDFLEIVSRHIAMTVENALALEEITALKEKLALEELKVDDIQNEDRFDEIVGKSAPPRPPSHRDRGAHRFDGAHLRRDRHRQRIDRACHPQSQLPQR